MVLKEPDVVPYLRERVVEAATDIKATADRNSLLEEVAETHEEFLRRLRDVAREALDLEDRLAGRADDAAGDERDRSASCWSTTIRRRVAGPGEGADPGGRAGTSARRSPAARRWTSSPSSARRS